MCPYTIRQATPNDILSVVEVYNSNPKFLANHLGFDVVDTKFITSEMAEMQASGFLSCVIVEEKSKNIVGVLDYKVGTAAYLSLIMLHSKYHGLGVGACVYRLFEEAMLQTKNTSIRIDVVNDYEGNVVCFWKKQGFVAQNNTELKWGKKHSKAVTMFKVLV